MKKFYITLAMLVACIVAKAEDPTLSLQGSGTQADPYKISTPADLQQLQNACNGATAAESGHYAGIYFTMTNDIDMTGVTGYLGIGTAPITAASSANYYFAGIFDGGNHRIKNLKIMGIKFNDAGKALTGTAANFSRRYVGVFGSLGDGGVIRNLIVDGTCVFAAANSVGGIVGEMKPGSQIENCANYGEIVCYDQNAGGIAGRMAGTKTGTAISITNCLNAGKVTIDNKTAGGITGDCQYGTIALCANIGNIQGKNINIAHNPFTQIQIGGIAGLSTAGTFYDCLNAGNVYAEKEKAGGMVGFMSISDPLGSIKNCLNVGPVVAYNTFLAGQMIGSTYIGFASTMNNYSGCAYDSQLLNNPLCATGEQLPATDQIRAFTTAQLTSGNAVEGLGNGFKYRAGYYPIPSTLNYPELDAAASMYVNLPQGSSATFVKAAGTLTSGTTATIDGTSDLFTINGSTLTPNPQNGCGNVEITLTKNGAKRTYYFGTFDLAMPGDGSEANPYIISTKDQMIRLGNATNIARCHFADTHFRLGADIDMQKDTTFHGMAIAYNLSENLSGAYLANFAGDFDGNGHKISNLNMVTVKFSADGKPLNFASGMPNYAGLFGSLGTGAVVRNLTLDSSCYMETNASCGGITGTLAGPAKIDNCNVAMHIRTYNRYSGGFFGYSATNNYVYPIEINNCVFSGLLESNFDYCGGISGFNGHGDTKIINCVNAGRIWMHHFNDGTKAETALSRTAGIAGVNNGLIEGCASYGSIVVEADPTCAKVDAIGGLVGQTSNSSKSLSSLKSNFSASQVYVTGAVTTADLGAMVGNIYYDASSGTQGEISANYCDLQLNAQPNVLGVTIPEGMFGSSFHGMNTADLTKGVAIDSLASHFTFENGYYPMPKTLANNAAVRAAAATFFTLPAGQSIRMISSDVTAPINNVMPLTATLTGENIFAIRNGNLITRGAAGSDVLTLTNGTFSAIYPLTKNATTHVSGVSDDADPIVNTIYYTTDGRIVLNPAAGTTVIAVSKTLSGASKVAKIVVKN